jgi:hypothetical protein
MVKGAETDAVPETVPVRMFCTVKTRSKKVPMVTLPKLKVLGVAESSSAAAAVPTVEQAL